MLNVGLFGFGLTGIALALTLYRMKNPLDILRATALPVIPSYRRALLQTVG
ncbi:MAG: hypothetical protein ACYC7E_07470 [Armatimonadota bacterium]